LAVTWSQFQSFAESRKVSDEECISKVGILVSLLLILTIFIGTAQASVGDVPEVDPGSMTAAVALLVGGYLVTLSHFRRK
jgi:hypothetical protein